LDCSVYERHLIETDERDDRLARGGHKFEENLNSIVTCSWHQVVRICGCVQALE